MGPDLTLDDVPALLSLQFTKRKALQITAALYDPMGLISAFTIRYKISLKEIVSHNLDWDQTLPDPLMDKWRKLAVDLVESDDIVFNRSVRPENAVNRPELTGDPQEWHDYPPQ